MSLRKWITVVALLAAGVLALLWFVGVAEQRRADPLLVDAPRGIEPSVHLASPGDLDPSDDRATATLRHAPSSNSEFRDDSSPASVDVVALFKELKLPEDYWSAFNSEHSFRRLDLAPMRKLVTEHGLTVNQLLDAHDSVPWQSELQPALIIACSFCANVDDADLDRLLAIADITPEQHATREFLPQMFPPYAAIRALGLLDAQGQLRRLAERALPLYLDWASLSSDQRQRGHMVSSAKLAMEELSVAEGDGLRAQVQRALDADPELGLTQAAWALHARGADRDEQLRILARGVAGSGFARTAMQDFDDEACVPALQDLARSAPDSVYGSYLRRSACAGLLNIATPIAWQSAERILLEAGPGSDVWEPLTGKSFDFPLPPQNLANMLECSARWSGTSINPEARVAIRSGIEESRALLDRCTLPRRIVRQTCANVRARVPEFSHDEESLGVALHVLVEHGERADRLFVREWLPRLSGGRRREIESRLATAR